MEDVEDGLFKALEPDGVQLCNKVKGLCVSALGEDAFDVAFEVWRGLFWCIRLHLMSVWPLEGLWFG